MIPQFIGVNGLLEFVLNGLQKNSAIDLSAIKFILEETHEMRKLSIKNVNQILPESLDELISISGDLIRSHLPKLIELDLGGIGGDAEQGTYLLDAIYGAEMQLKKLDVSKNPQWKESESFLELLCGILKK